MIGSLIRNGNQRQQAIDMRPGQTKAGQSGQLPIVEPLVEAIYQVVTAIQGIQRSAIEQASNPGELGDSGLGFGGLGCG